MLGFDDAEGDPCFWGVTYLSPILQLLNMKVCGRTQLFDTAALVTNRK